MKKVFLRIALAAVAVFVIYNLISLFNTPETTSTVQMNTVEITYNFDGVVCRNERVISTSMTQSGWLEPSVSENEMVKSGKMLGVYYDGELDSETKAKLNEINFMLEEMSMSSEELGKLDTGGSKLDNDIEEKKQKLKEALRQRDMSKAKIISEEISLLLSRRAQLNSEEEAVPVTYEELVLEKEQIESENNVNKEEIHAPLHGIFTTQIDGFESVLNQNAAMSMTVDDYETILKKRTESVDEDIVNVCKIVDNSQWWISVRAGEEDVKNFKIGEKLKIRIAGESKDLDANVKYISASKGGEYIITFASSISSDYILQNRFMNVTVVKESYSGLEVPMKAVRVKDGKTGVYVKANNATKFREIEIIYKNEEIAICKVGSSALNSNTLLLYDEVVVN